MKKGCQYLCPKFKALAERFCIENHNLSEILVRYFCCSWKRLYCAHFSSILVLQELHERYLLILYTTCADRLTFLRLFSDLTHSSSGLVIVNFARAIVNCLFSETSRAKTNHFKLNKPLMDYTSKDSALDCLQWVGTNANFLLLQRRLNPTPSPVVDSDTHESTNVGLVPRLQTQDVCSSLSGLANVSSKVSLVRCQSLDNSEDSCRATWMQYPQKWCTHHPALHSHLYSERSRLITKLVPCKGTASYAHKVKTLLPAKRHCVLQCQGFGYYSW